MKPSLLAVFAACTALLLGACSANETTLVPMKFGNSTAFKTASGISAGALDFETVDLTTTFSVPARKTSGHASITGKVSSDGYPYFLLAGAISGIRVNGEETEFQRVSDPDRRNQLVLVKRLLTANEGASIEVDYTMSASETSFNGGGVGFLTSMADLKTGSFFERYGPTGFENDQYALTWTLVIEGGTLTEKLFTNGTVEAHAKGEGEETWQVAFPDYFNTSAPYLHLTSRSDLQETHFTVQGLTKSIPVTVYGTSASTIASAVRLLPGWFAELENDYGPYAHESFTAYLSGTGGMEYAGATISALDSLDHELTHSWFARGVMPANGRSGWIDEGVASWRDHGYFWSTSLNTRLPANLANDSPYERFTPLNCYHDGRWLFAELDQTFAKSGGFKKVLRSLFETYAHKTITTETFLDFVSAQTDVDLQERFQRYVYGDYKIVKTGIETAVFNPAIDSHHPRPLTREDELKLR